MLGEAACCGFESSSLSGQSTVGGWTGGPPGTNLQYFDDDEPEGKPDISNNQGIAVEIEQRPHNEDANVASREQNQNGDVADQRQAAAPIDQTSRYPKRDRRPPAFYGGYRYW